MDRYEITKIILSRIQSFDPENASKIMGYILIQDYAEKDMAKLAFGEETLLVSLISQVKTYLGLSSNSLSATSSSPSPFSPISNHPIRHGPFPQSSPKIVVPNNGFNMNPSSPSSPWSGSAFSEQYRSPRPGSALSYAAVVNGSHTSSNHHPSGSAFFGNNGCSVVDSEYGSVQVQDSLAFLDDSLVKNVDFVDPIVSPSGRSDSLLFPYGNGKPNWVESGSYGDLHPHHPLHRRSYSVNDAFLGGGGFEDGGAGGYGWRPCMYYARGFCKNGSSCKFMHGGFAAESPEGQVAGKVDGLDELVRFKAIQHPRFAAASQLMAAGAHPYPSNKINIFNENQRSAAAALMMGDDFHKFGPCRPERNEFAATGFGGNANSSSRQIYLTFPADSTFKEEDVSNYFSMYGPVQDVRIPCQQKRMFGFVTFVYPETVKIILAKGNPHFVCDSRVLVKPYKEKGKVPDKKQQQQQQQMERGEFSMCLSPSVLDSREAFDHIPIGARMYYNTQELMLRRKIEQEAELQQALELQGRRLINLQLMDLKNHHHDHQYQPNLSPGAPNSPSTQSYNQSLVLPADGASQEVHEDHKDSPWEAKSRTGATDTKALEEEDEACKKIVSNGGNGREENSNVEDLDLRESLEHILPDNLFSSPTKSVADRNSVFSTASTEAEDSAPEISPNNTSTPPSASTLSMASHKSCYLPMSSH